VFGRISDQLFYRCHNSDGDVASLFRPHAHMESCASIQTWTLALVFFGNLARSFWQLSSYFRKLCTEIGRKHSNGYAPTSLTAPSTTRLPGNPPTKDRSSRERSFPCSAAMRNLLSLHLAVTTMSESLRAAAKAISRLIRSICRRLFAPKWLREYEKSARASKRSPSGKP
jgi:hypothetical protein